MVYHSAVEKIGEFTCSDSRINELQKIVERSDLSNLYYFPTDCPQREKNGWTGDAAVSAEQFALNFNVDSSFCEWLNNVRLAQNGKGELPGIVPTAGWGYAWGNGPAWDSALVELPYVCYKYFGNKKCLQDNSLAIFKYIQNINSKLNAKGLISYGLGDWCQTFKANEGVYDTPVEIVDTIMCINICRKAATIFKILAEQDNLHLAEDTAKLLLSNFCKEYVAEGKILCATQTAPAMGLYYDIFNTDEQCKAFEYLLELISAAGERFNVGILGARVIFHVLTNFNKTDLALKLITNKSYPSYTYQLDRGATTLWESFMEMDDSGEYVRKDGNKIISLNHHFFGDISAWFYKALGGLNVVDSKTVEVCPSFLAELSYVNVSRTFKDGYVSIKWQRSGNKILCEIISRNIKIINLIPKNKNIIVKEINQ